MLEHWCWEPAVLNRFASHNLTGEPMPGELVAGLIAARTAASGVLTMLQLSLATLDIAYHSAGYQGDSTATLAGVYAQHGLHHIEGTHRQSGFLHVFGHPGQDAAYYGYLWSQVLGDDMYTRFEAAGPLDPATGAAYRSGDHAQGRLTLRVIRDALASLAECQADDPNLHYLDGTMLYGEDDAAAHPLPDAPHPDTATHQLIGERFAEYAFESTGPFAAHTGRGSTA